VGAALNVGLTPVEIKELLYQTFPYLGIAKIGQDRMRRLRDERRQP